MWMDMKRGSKKILKFKDLRCQTFEQEVKTLQKANAKDDQTFIITSA